MQPTSRRPNRPLPRSRGPSLLAAALVAGFSLGAHALPQAEPGEYREEIDVRRVVIDARPVDRHGRIIRDLGPADFRVWVDGEPAPVVGAEWVEPGAGETDGDRALTAGGVLSAGASRLSGAAAPAGRTILLFFQRDTLPTRMNGLLKALPQAERFIDSLAADDRVAIFVHDSDLRLHSDLSGDKEWLRAILRDTVVRYRAPPAMPASSRSGLALDFDAQAGLDVTSGEEALLLVARSVRHIPGPKSMLFFSWGLGRMYGGAVHLGRDYGAALRALLDARISVFSLDVAQAEYHSLEGPLERVAEDTGGFYKKTYYSTIFAVDSVSQAIEGRYELTIRSPAGRAGRRELRVRLSGVKGNVYHRPFFVEAPGG